MYCNYLLIQRARRYDPPLGTIKRSGRSRATREKLLVGDPEESRLHVLQREARPQTAVETRGAADGAAATPARLDLVHAGEERLHVVADEVRPLADGVALGPLGALGHEHGGDAAGSVDLGEVGGAVELDQLALLRQPEGLAGREAERLGERLVAALVPRVDLALILPEHLDRLRHAGVPAQALVELGRGTDGTVRVDVADVLDDGADAGVVGLLGVTEQPEAQAAVCIQVVQHDLEAAGVETEVQRHEPLPNVSE